MLRVDIGFYKNDDYRTTLSSLLDRVLMSSWLARNIDCSSVAANGGLHVLCP